MGDLNLCNPHPEYVMWWNVLSMWTGCLVDRCENVLGGPNRINMSFKLRYLYRKICHPYKNLIESKFTLNVPLESRPGRVGPSANADVYNAAYRFKEGSRASSLARSRASSRAPSLAESGPGSARRGASVASARRHSCAHSIVVPGRRSGTFSEVLLPSSHHVGGASLAGLCLRLYHALDSQNYLIRVTWSWLRCNRVTLTIWL